MARGNATADVTERCAAEMLRVARERLRSALEILGGGAETTVLDESVRGAEVLALDAGDVLGMLCEHRSAKS